VTFRMILAFVMLGALVACGGDAPSGASVPANSKGNAAKGKIKFASSCFSCHGTDGKGITGLTPSLQTSPFVKAQNDDQLVEFIKKGRPSNDPANTRRIEMPAKGGDSSLSDEDLHDIVTFIRTVQK